MEDIVLEGICKAFDGKTVLNGFSAVLPCGRVTAVMAPSGAGKTTLLRLLMGLDVPDSGRIEGLAGHRMAAVFQEDRLCGYLSPVDNIRLVNPARTAQEVRAALAEMGLAGCEAQPCRELSGGMNRRVALLRALLADADLLLTKRVVDRCYNMNVPCTQVESMEKLGRACGIDVKAAAAGLLR